MSLDVILVMSCVLDQQSNIQKGTSGRLIWCRCAEWIGAHALEPERQVMGYYDHAGMKT